MLDKKNLKPPAIVADLELTTKDTGFTMSSASLTGSLLRTLVASKPAGSFLELGTGTGMGTAWLLDGMDQTAHLTSVDSNENVSIIAKRFLSTDARVTFLITDGAAFIRSCQEQRRTFDLIFADTAPGKFSLLDDTLGLLKKGGFYVIDDLHFQPAWVEGHAAQVDSLIASFERRTDVRVTMLDWSTGVIVAAKL